MSCTIFNRSALLGALLASTLSAQALSPPATPVAARYELVDALGSTDVVVDIAVDPAGLRPALLYYDTTTAEADTAKPIPLKLARFDRFSWVIREFGLVNRRDLSAPDERSLRLAIDEGGAPHALVVESNGAGTADDALVYFGLDTQGSPLREQIDLGGISQIALAVDVIREPYVAYIKDNGNLIIRRRANGAWQQIALSPAPSNARSPSFAPLPAQPMFLNMHLAWLEYAANGTVLHHASVSTQTATDEVVASNAIQFSLTTPQLVVDRFGTLELAYVSTVNPVVPTIQLRQRPFGQSTWQCIDTGCSLPTGPLSPGFTLSPHAYVQGAVNYRDTSFISRILRREGEGWTSYAIADIASAQGSALDKFGNVYTTGIDRSTHRDLFQVRIGGPWESRSRIPFDSNTILSQPLDVASDAFGHPIVYARRSCCSGDPRGALWLVGQGEDFIEHALPGAFTSAEASIAVAPDGIVHVALYDSDQQDLVHAEFSPANDSWVVTRVDTLGDVGSSPTMLIGKDGTPMIVYRRRPDLMHLAIRPSGGSWSIRTLSAGVLDAAHPVAVTRGDVFKVHVSWFDESAQQLRVTTVSGDPLVPSSITSTDTVPLIAGRTRGRVHDVAMMGDSGVAVAFSDEVPGQSQLAYRYRDFVGQWFDPGAQPLPFSADIISRISLDTTLQAPGGARVAWIAAGRLHYAEKHLGFNPWDSEDLGTLAANAPLHLGAAGPLRITYGDGNGLFMLERLEALGGDSAIGEVLGRGTGGSGQAGLCVCFLPDPLRPQDFRDCFSSQDPPRHALGTMPPSRDVLAEMRTLFSTTPAGRYYLQLFAEHAPEIIRMTLSDPAQLAERTRTLSDLLPAMAALVESPTLGSQYRFKSELIDNARGVVQGWGEAGSPALAAAVANELARTNNFSQFTGMTFTQWFAALSVGNATDRVFVDGFE